MLKMSTKTDIAFFLATFVAAGLLFSQPASAMTPAQNKIILPVPAKSARVVFTAAGGGIGKPGKILSKTRMVNGKNVCGKTHDHPQKSKRNPRGHIDSECCLDPDETPNSLCYYPPAKYGNLIQKYLAGLKKK